DLRAQIMPAFLLGLTVDSSGNICVVGSQQNLGDCLVAKLDPSGNLLWSIDLGGGGAALAVAADAAGDFYVSGRETAANFPGTSQTNTTGGYYAFVSKVNSSGSLQWSTIAPGVGWGVALDSSGDIYATGFNGEAFGATTVSKLDSSGNLLWTKSGFL